MISFTLLTSTPKDLRDFLLARGFLQEDATTKALPVLPGVECVEVPNSIVTTPAVLDKDGAFVTPAVYDTRRVYMVKVSGVSEGDEVSGKAQVNADGSPKLIWQKTKLGAYILANSTAENATDGAGKTFRGRKVTGMNVWLLNEVDGAQLGVWQ